MKLAMFSINSVLIGLVTLAGCSSAGGGGGGSSSKPPSTVLIKEYYDAPSNTMIKEEGMVLVGSDGAPTTTKHGVWKSYFTPAEGNALKLERIYNQGVWDEAQPWMEYNADTSIRDTMYDGVF